MNASLPMPADAPSAAERMNVELRARIERTRALTAALAADSAAGCFTSGPHREAWRARYAVTEMVELMTGGGQ